jgi:ribonuclease HI
MIPKGFDLVLFADGGSRGNPGPAGAGAILLDDQGTAVAELSRFLGRTTNNVAEYQGLIMGLEAASKEGASSLAVRLDSELLVKQLNGQYRVKAPNLKPLYQKAQGLLRGFKRVDIQHVRREYNKEADRLANLAMDKGS